MNRPVHFEIISSAPERLVKFYSEVFGWKLEKWGEMPYWLTNAGAEEGPTAPGIGGAIAANTDGLKQAVVNTIGVEDIDIAIANVLSAGGKVVTPKAMIPTIGWFSYCADPEGILFGVIQMVEHSEGSPA